MTTWPLILVVDDNDIILDLLRRLFAMWGYALDHEADGGRVAALVAEHDYALVIMDLLLANGMTGIDAAMAIRKLPEPKASTPIIAITGGMAKTSIAELGSARFAALLQKPILPDDLRSAIEHALSGTHAA